MTEDTVRRFAVCLFTFKLSPASNYTAWLQRQLRRQRLQCSWISSPELSADGPHAAGLDLSYSRFRQSLKTFYLVSGTKAQCEFSCIFKSSYLLTYVNVHIALFTQPRSFAREFNSHRTRSHQVKGDCHYSEMNVVLVTVYRTI